MKRAARLFAAVGLADVLIVGGIALLAIGTSYLSPAAPWLLVGGMAAATGYVSAFLRRPRSR